MSIHPNAALLLRRIGLTDRIKTIGTPIAGLLLRTSQGERIDTSARRSSSVQSYNVHRAEFLKLLADAQPLRTLHLDHRLSQARETNGRVQLTFAHGATVEADLVIGADGIHSVVQREIGLKTYPSSEGITAYRGLIPRERVSWAKHRRQNVNVAWERPHFPVLSGVERPLDQHGRLCPDQSGVRGILDGSG
jgi:salicylate hydroxylase